LGSSLRESSVSDKVSVRNVKRFLKFSVDTLEIIVIGGKGGNMSV
jgi:hypothetical protein